MSKEMTKAEFLVLPKKERKRLAAKRTIERRKAAKAGGDIPPTYAEQFGVSKRKGKPFGAKSVSQEPSKARPRKGPSLEEVERKRRAFLRSTMPEPRPERIVPSWRDILGGMLHCTGKGMLGEYLEEAKNRGMKKQMVYKEGDKVVGTIFAENITSVQKGKLRAILTSAHYTKTFTFGEVEDIV